MKLKHYPKTKPSGVEISKARLETKEGDPQS